MANRIHGKLICRRVRFGVRGTLPVKAVLPEVLELNNVCDAEVDRCQSVTKAAGCASIYANTELSTGVTAARWLHAFLWLAFTSPRTLIPPPSWLNFQN